VDAYQSVPPEFHVARACAPSRARDDARGEQSTSTFRERLGDLNPSSTSTRAVCPAPRADARTRNKITDRARAPVDRAIDRTSRRTLRRARSTVVVASCVLV